MASTTTSAPLELRTSHGGAQTVEGAWNPDGTTNDCANWTSTDAALVASLALPSSVTASFSGRAVGPCDAVNGLACFGDNSDAEVPVVAPTPRRLAFLSTSSFDPGTGIATADAICQRDACTAGLTGSVDCAIDTGTLRTFKSYLHTSAQPAWERFDLTGPNWVRPDGLAFLRRASDLAADGAGHSAPLSVTVSGSFPGNPGSVWIGDPAGTSTCEDWTSNNAQGRLSGFFSDGNAALSLGTDLACTTPLLVYCLEE